KNLNPCISELIFAACSACTSPSRAPCLRTHRSPAVAGAYQALALATIVVRLVVRALHGTTRTTGAAGALGAHAGRLPRGMLGRRGSLSHDRRHATPLA